MKYVWLLTLLLISCSKEERLPDPSLSQVSHDCSVVAKKLNFTYTVNTDVINGIDSYSCSFKYQDGKGGFELTGHEPHGAREILSIVRELPNRPRFVKCTELRKCENQKYTEIRTECYIKCGKDSNYPFFGSEDD